MDWISATSVSELQKLGTCKKVRDEVKKETKKFESNALTLKCGSSWKQLFEAIQSYKKVKNHFQGDSKHPYFRSETHRVIYALTELDGRTRLVELGVTDKHYDNAQVLKKWYRDLARLIQPDSCDHPHAEFAFQQLQSLNAELKD